MSNLRRAADLELMARSFADKLANLSDGEVNQLEEKIFSDVLEDLGNAVKWWDFRAAGGVEIEPNGLGSD